jgi:hypothetical protein
MRMKKIRIIKKSRVKHECYNNHDIPAGQTCYIHSGVENGKWYNYYKCEFCNTASEILINNYNHITNEFDNPIINNIYVYPKNINLFHKTVSYEDKEAFQYYPNISFDDFYKILMGEK